MPRPVIVQTATGFNGDPAAPTVTINGVASGSDLILVVALMASGQTVTGASSGVSGAFSLITSTDPGDGEQSIWRLRGVASGAHIVTLTMSANRIAVVTVHEVTGIVAVGNTGTATVVNTSPYSTNTMEAGTNSIAFGAITTGDSVGGVCASITPTDWVQDGSGTDGLSCSRSYHASPTVPLVMTATVGVAFGTGSMTAVVFVAALPSDTPRPIGGRGATW